jgi:hypothetical protein
MGEVIRFEFIYYQIQVLLYCEGQRNCYKLEESSSLRRGDDIIHLFVQKTIFKWSHEIRLLHVRLETKTKNGCQNP